MDLSRVGTAEDALDLIDAHPRTFDVIVIDSSFDDGRQACRRLAKQLPDVPIIVLVASADPSAVEALLAAGASDCMVHPDHGALVLRIRVALKLRDERAHRSNRVTRLRGLVKRLQATNSELERLACVDLLTGIANRKHTLSRLHAEWKRATRDRTELALVMIDVDAFHEFNERYGHLGGDACLRRVAGTMVQCLRRPSDLLGRYGGEEFVAILPGTDADGARIVSERLRASVEGLQIGHDASPCSEFVTISVGFGACMPGTLTDPAKLIATADDGVRTAKAQGRNGVVGAASSASSGPSGRSRRPSTDWTRFSPVIADPWFADRIPDFLASNRIDAATMIAALDAGQLDRVQQIARKLKVSGHGFGLDEVARLGLLIERAALRADADGVRIAAVDLERYVDHVQIVYRREFNTESVIG